MTTARQPACHLPDHLPVRQVTAPCLGDCLWCVFPCIINVVQIGLVFSDPDTAPDAVNSWFHRCAYVMLFNGYITVVGVTCATVWANTEHWAQDRHTVVNLKPLHSSAMDSTAELNRQENKGEAVYPHAYF
jgi:hypothetical protein